MVSDVLLEGEAETKVVRKLKTVWIKQEGAKAKDSED